VEETWIRGEGQRGLFCVKCKEYTTEAHPLARRFSEMHYWCRYQGHGVGLIEGVRSYRINDWVLGKSKYQWAWSPLEELSIAGREE